VHTLSAADGRRRRYDLAPGEQRVVDNGAFAFVHLFLPTPSNWAFDGALSSLRTELTERVFLLFGR